MTNRESTTALIVVDVQRAFDEWEAAGKRRNNPDAVARIVDLLDAFRTQRAPIFHIRHEGTCPNSSFRPGGTGFPVKDEARELCGEPVIVKRVNSAFIGTGLGTLIRGAGHGPLIVTGVLTHNSIEATVRMGGNLGFEILVVSDGCFAVDKKTLDGRVFRAEDVHALSLANMSGEYGAIVDTAWILDRA
jgi:nicotinamidase-related amidase